MTSTISVLREILSEGKAQTQTEIQVELQHRGIMSSQSKISRLLHQIGAVKITDNFGKTHYRLPHETGLLHELTSPQEKILFHQWVLDISANQTLIIIHTSPGAAAMIARIIDLNRIKLGILGTIAGDDTIFIAPQNNDHIHETLHKISQLLDI